MFLHPDLPLSLTQMILGAEQTCQPHSQPGHWLTWKDVHVWLSCSQRNTHFYCFSLLLRFFCPRAATAVPMQSLPLAGQGLSKATQSKPWESLWEQKCHSQCLPAKSLSCQHGDPPKVQAQLHPRANLTASSSTCSFSLDPLAGIPGSCRVWTHPAPSLSRVFLLQSSFQEDFN